MMSKPKYLKFKGKPHLVHIEVMEQYLGFKIPNGCVVHHKDENTYNNHIDNLALYLSLADHVEKHRQLKCIKLGIPIWYRYCNTHSTYEDPINLESRVSKNNQRYFSHKCANKKSYKTRQTEIHGNYRK